MSDDDPRKHAPDEHWTEFDYTESVIVVMGLQALDPDKLTPAARSRRLELIEIFNQRITGYISEA